MWTELHYVTLFLCCTDVLSTYIINKVFKSTHLIPSIGLCSIRFAQQGVPEGLALEVDLLHSRGSSKSRFLAGMEDISTHLLVVVVVVATTIVL